MSQDAIVGTVLHCLQHNQNNNYDADADDNDDDEDNYDDENDENEDDENRRRTGVDTGCTTKIIMLKFKQLL